MASKYSKIVNDIIREFGVDNEPDVSYEIISALDKLKAPECVMRDWALEPIRRRTMTEKRVRNSQRYKNKCERRGADNRRIISKKIGWINQGHSSNPTPVRIRLEQHATKGWRLYRERS